jgi:acetylornithine deacetylase/succinyl-diaminopimelate desuccinylase-like protein
MNPLPHFKQRSTVSGAAMTPDVYFDTHEPRFLDELQTFLRIPSISSQPEHATDVVRAAEWVADRLGRAGAEHVRVLPTGGHPVVYGDWLHAADKPTVLLYGHFDVQPADPLELWDHPPFEPAIRDDRIYARGSSDDKGNLLIPIIAFEALLAEDGALPVNVKFLFEGQEEIGSPQLNQFTTDQRNLLMADVAISADGGQWAENQPMLISGRRGLCALEITVESARSDTHSGSFGGTFMNPIDALAAIIASFRDTSGKILVKGFFDDVREISPELKRHFEAVPFDADRHMADLGIAALFGEPGFTTHERTWVRPTLEVNGIWGGYQGDGIKTVIPSQAHAKITCRLVPDQSPDEVAEAVMTHIKQTAPPEVRVAVSNLGDSADPYSIPLNHPGHRVAGEVLERLYGKAPLLAAMGGTIPICGILHQNLGIHMVNFAFGLRDERIHAPNEFFRLASFRRGLRGYAMLLSALGECQELMTTK